MNKLCTCFPLLICLFSTASVAEEAGEEQVAVKAATFAFSADTTFSNTDFYYLQGDGTFAINDDFGVTLGINNVYLDYEDGSNDIQNFRVGGFFRNPEYGRVEVAYQQAFFDEHENDFYSLTGEYYFENWTLGGFFLSDDLSNLNDLNLYSNIYVNENTRIEVN